MEMDPKLTLNVVSALLVHLDKTGVISLPAFCDQLALQRAAQAMSGKTGLAESTRSYEEQLRSAFPR
jgi:hypothetical protein